MKEKRSSKPAPKADAPYDVGNAGDVTAFWETATKRRGVEELRAKRGRKLKAKQIAKNKLRYDLLLIYSLGIGALARAGRQAGQRSISFCCTSGLTPPRDLMSRYQP